MTDILTRLAALTQKDENGLFHCQCGGQPNLRTKQKGSSDVKCPSCKLQGAIRKYECDAIAVWNRRAREAALIALVQEATAEIERFRAMVNGLLPMHSSLPKEARIRWLDDVKAARHALNPQESANGQD